MFSKKHSLIPTNEKKWQYTHSQPSLLHKVFEATVKQYGNNIAVSHADVSISYIQLNSYANQLARYLQNLEISPNFEQAHANVDATIRVGIYLAQSPAITQSILACLKIGYAFVPLTTDAEVSEERLVTIVQSVQPQVLITTRYIDRKRVIDQATLQGSYILYLDELDNELSLLNDGNLNCNISLEALAYITYTSGSTGVPKGAMIPQRNLLPCIQSAIAALSITDVSKGAQLASIGFDASIMEIFMILLCGATLYLVPRNATGYLDFAQLEEFYLTHHINVGIATPSLLRLLDSRKFSHFHVIYTGEAGNPQGWNGKNGYGVSECTIAATINGIPMQGVQVWILKHGTSLSSEYPWEIAKNGEDGEICLSGDCLGLGYWVDSENTALRFIKIPHPQDINTTLKLYCTGDHGYMDENNHLVVKGRKDRQIKIHGKLICPEEIELALSNYKKGNALTAVYVDVVLYEDDRPPRFIAFLFVNDDYFHLLELDDIQNYLRHQLTTGMIPSYS